MNVETFANTGARLSQPDKAWLTANGIDSSRTAGRDEMVTSNGYNVSKPKTTQELQEMLNRPAITPEQRNPKLTTEAQQATQTLSTAAKREPTGEHSTREANRGQQTKPTGISR